MQGMRFKSLATRTTVLTLVLSQPAWGAEPYDSKALSLGGSFVTTRSEPNSCYWNPANLEASRDTLLLGPQLSLVGGSTFEPWSDTMKLFDPEPGGNQGALLAYLKALSLFDRTLLAKSANAVFPGPLDAALPAEFKTFGSAQLSLGGVTLRLGQGKAFSFRTIIKGPSATLSAYGPGMIENAGILTAADREIGAKVLSLNSKVASGDLNLSSITQDASAILDAVEAGLGPELLAQGATISLAVTEGGYLTNAFSYQIPISDGTSAEGQIAETFVGATLKVHAAAGIWGLDRFVQKAAADYLAASGEEPIKITVPARIDVDSSFDFKDRLSALRTALTAFSRSPEAGLAGLRSAAADFSKVSSHRVVLHRASPLGVGLDLGLYAPLGRGFSGGAVLQNLTFWPGDKVVYEGKVQDGKLGLTETSRQFENFTFTEPLGARLGLAWRGLPYLSVHGEVGETLVAGPGFRSLSLPTVHVGVEGTPLSWLTLRAGVEAGGSGSPSTGVGLGLNFGAIKLDLAGNADFGLRSVGLATSLVAGI